MMCFLYFHPRRQYVVVCRCEIAVHGLCAAVAYALAADVMCKVGLWAWAGKPWAASPSWVGEATIFLSTSVAYVAVTVSRRGQNRVAAAVAPGAVARRRPRRAVRAWEERGGDGGGGGAADRMRDGGRGGNDAGAAGGNGGRGGDGGDGGGGDAGGGGDGAGAENDDNANGDAIIAAAAAIGVRALGPEFAGADADDAAVIPAAPAALPAPLPMLPAPPNLMHGLGADPGGEPGALGVDVD